MSADLAEDESTKPVKNDQGGVFIFLGGADGIEEIASQEIYGVIPDQEKGWIPKASLYFGQALASGDFNGDGLCDLAMGSRAYEHDGKGNAGAILLFGGTEEGLSAEPIRAWAGTNGEDAESYFSYCLAMADVDQDELSDLIACQRDHDHEGTSNTGAIRIFKGDDGLSLDPSDGFLSADTSDWVVTGDKGGDRLGYSVSVADVTGDGVVDIVAGAGADEALGHPGNTGTLNVYRGNVAAMPETAPSRKVAGGKSNDLFGVAVGAIGDLDGDGASELGAIAFNTDEEGTNVPRFYMAWGRDTATIPWGSDWNYQDDGLEPDPAWIEIDFDDSQWAQGPAQLGFGDDDEATITNEDAKTVYFRRTVEIAKPESFTEFIVRYDDGFALWVNGQLVHVQNLKEGEEGLTHDAKAASQSENSLVRFSPSDEDGSPFVEGQNIIAVMMKQAGNAGGDMSFDLELSLYQAATSDEGPLELLAMPNAMSNDQNGRSVAIIEDITNDGYEDVLVGAPGAAPNGKGIEFGQVHIYQGVESGVSPDVFGSLSGFGQTANGIEVGHVVAQVGDVDGDGHEDFAFHARETSQPKNYNSGSYESPPACENKKSSVGATYVFQGGPGAGYTSEEPAFIFFGPEANRDPDRMMGGFDIDGDGYDDIALGSRGFRGPDNVSSAGGVAIYRGGPDTPGKTTIVCETYGHFIGLKSGDQMGRGLAVLGALDDDDCDDIAIGADQEDLDGKSNQGSVRVIYGWGPSCNSAYPRVITLVPGGANSRAGWALDGGHDLDGDGLPDLLVGAPDYRQGSSRVGAVFVLTGAYLSSLEPDITITGDLPKNPTLYPFAPTNGELQVIHGTNDTNSGTNMSWFGSSVKFVPALAGSQPGIAVGAYNGNNPGPNRVGDVRVWSYQDGTFELVAAVGGETLRPKSRFGEFFDAGLIKGIPTLVIGAWYGTAFDSVDAVDDGTVYVVPLK